MFVAAENNIKNRLEQTKALLKTLKQLHYDISNVNFKFIGECRHCSYSIHDIVADFVLDKTGTYKPFSGIDNLIYLINLSSEDPKYKEVNTVSTPVVTTIRRKSSA